MRLDHNLIDPDPIIRRNAFRSAYRSQTTPEIIELALADPAFYIRADAINIIPLAEEHYIRALRDPHPKVRTEAVRRASSLTATQIAEALSDPAEEVRSAAAFLPKLADSQRTQLLRDPSPAVRASAVKAANSLTPAQHTSALSDPDWQVRQEAVFLTGLTQAQLDTATNDDSAAVRAAAREMGGKSSACGAMKDAAYRLRCLVT